MPDDEKMEVLGIMPNFPSLVLADQLVIGVREHGAVYISEEEDLYKVASDEDFINVGLQQFGQKV